MPKKQAAPEVAPAPEPEPEVEPEWPLAWLGDASRMVPGYPQSDLIVDAATGRALVATGLWARMEPPQDAQEPQDAPQSAATPQESDPAPSAA